MNDGTDDAGYPGTTHMLLAYLWGLQEGMPSGQIFRVSIVLDQHHLPLPVLQVHSRVELKGDVYFQLVSNIPAS